MLNQDWNVRWVAEALNATAVGPFAWLRKAPHGPALASIASRLAAGGLRLLNVLGLACHWPEFARAVHRDAAHCRMPGQCFAPMVRYAFRELNTDLQRCARGVARHLCSANASAALVALVAGLDGQISHYPSLTTECITLGSSLSLWEEHAGVMGDCPEVYDPGMQCAHSLFQAAQLSAAALSDFSRMAAEDFGIGDWVFHAGWGSDRVAILGGLLSGFEGDASHRSSGLRMAEVGVFQANTSVALLQRFPDLQMLLVDPYHLHSENPNSTYQQLDEFYVSSRDVFMAAAQWTHPYRKRATHLLQQSVEAAKWVAPGSLDLVFIDGDHRYESVMLDIQAWWPCIRAGGVIAGHDFSLTFPGVVEAATKFALSLNIRLYFAPEIWWVIKPYDGEPRGHWTDSLFSDHMNRRRGSCYF
mmetsp:Transcript_70751/g.207233  ORF Transcript_70751/g.207233 Transcript_70751/m.207233 type:complete len:416 (+) Transcript_70751:69-1316(+)